MVRLETGPIAEGRPNDPLPFNFLQLWVTASGEGEGNLHRKFSKQMMQLQAELMVSALSPPRVKLSTGSEYVCYGFNGK